MKIDIQGARAHNLKDVNVSIPKEKLTVVTGLSGSGKSSLAFDTLYAEGQRRYVESLSSYARQFLGRLDKPDVDRIDGLSPAVAIEQRSASGGPRSTVGTRTEILDHLRMLYARIGQTRSPVSGEVVRKDSVTDVVQHILQAPTSRLLIVAPLPAREDRSPEDQCRVLLQQGYTRAWTDKGAVRLEDVQADKVLGIVVDRFSPASAAEDPGRVADSADTALFEGGGQCEVWHIEEDGSTTCTAFNDRFERDGILFPEPSPGHVQLQQSSGCMQHMRRVWPCVGHRPRQGHSRPHPIPLRRSGRPVAGRTNGTLERPHGHGGLQRRFACAYAVA